MMKTIKLQRINYHNFKGIKDFVVELNGENIAISGQNAAGKTSLFDGFWWLLFGKNSSEATKFNPKPLDEKGNEILGLEPEVEATLVVDEGTVTLRRKLAEVWTKPRGQVEKERKSDKTELYVDDVPYKLKDYTAYVDGLIDEETFKLLTNPAAFNNLKWQDRRKILLTLSGEVDDEKVIDSTDYPDVLHKILSDHTAEEQRKIIAAQRRKLKGDIDSIPQRIDEANRAMPEVSTTSEDSLKAMLTEYQQKYEGLQSELVAIDSAATSSDAREQKAKLQSELTDKQSSYFQGMQLTLNDLVTDLSDTRMKADKLSSQVGHLKEAVVRDQNILTAKRTQKDELLKQYHELSDTKFDEESLTCPTCGQEYPADKQDELKGHFNEQKADKLETLVTQGKALAEKIETLEHQLVQETENADHMAGQLTVVNQNLAQLQKEYDDQKLKVPPFEQTTIYKDIKAKIADCDQTIESGKGGNEAEKAKVREEIAKIQAGISEVQTELSKYETRRKQEERINELTSEQSELTKTYNALEMQSFALDQYVHNKATAQEQEINDMFGLVTFKLFETQKNGEINDICEAMVDGVPYSTDLNNAARINAGLDIINTLSKHYGVSAPIFVDNAESVNEIMTVDAQEIRLIVSNDKELTTKVGEA